MGDTAGAAIGKSGESKETLYVMDPSVPRVRTAVDEEKWVVRERRRAAQCVAAHPTHSRVAYHRKSVKATAFPLAIPVVLYVEAPL